MYLGIGIDIVSIKRIKEIYNKFGKKFLSKIGIEDKNLSLDEIAGLFAAKEAGFKALRPTNIVFNPKEVEIIKKRGGAPVLFYKGKLRKRWKLLRRPKVLVSISHEKEFAIALVVLQKNEKFSLFKNYKE